MQFNSNSYCSMTGFASSCLHIPFDTLGGFAFGCRLDLDLKVFPRADAFDAVVAEGYERATDGKALRVVHGGLE